MTSADLSRRVGKVVGYPPLSELGDLQRREFHEALLDVGGFEDLPGKWQTAILKAEQPVDWRQRNTGPAVSAPVNQPSSRGDPGEARRPRRDGRLGSRVRGSSPA
jgi:hypothetical protein